MEFRNPNEGALEGELQFPLRPEQSITGFTLDMNGKMRMVVPVEKAKGRQVFEDVTRTRVDPALLEVTEGNNYKLSLYALPAKVTRRVVLEISETLSRGTSASSAALGYQPPPLNGRTVSFAGRDWLVLDVAAWGYGKKESGDINGYLPLHHHFDNAARVCLQVPPSSAFVAVVALGELAGTVKLNRNAQVVPMTTFAAQRLK